jgi:diacylglycerol O-acyltransferase
VFPPLPIRHPTWEDDPGFDIRRHIFHASIKHGTQAELQALAGQIFTGIMDRNRPLWDLTIVDGLKGGRSALIGRVHHCMVDGVAGVELMNVMMDASPHPQPLPPKQPFHPAPPPDTVTRLADNVFGLYTEMIGRVLKAESSTLNYSPAILSDLTPAKLSLLARVVPELLFTPMDRLPFNKPVLGTRLVSWAEFTMAEFNAIREATGAKLNDVILTVITAAVQRYVRLHGQPLKNRVLRLMVPVNLRGGAQVMGNQVSIFPVSTPLDITDPIELLRTIRQRTESWKRSHAAEMLVLIASWFGTTRISAQGLSVFLSNILQTPLNMVCTNVPGPPAPIYLLGREMLTWYPYVPIGSDMGVGSAIASYNGKLYFGLSGDYNCAPDLDRLRDFIYEAFSEIREALGAAPGRRTRPKPVAAGRPNGGRARNGRAVRSRAIATPVLTR